MTDLLADGQVAPSRCRFLFRPPRQGVPVKPQRNRPSARTVGYAFLVGGFGMFGLVSLVFAMGAEAVDLQVYRAGSEALLDGRELYDVPVWEDFAFTYPPFAALFFAPLTLVSAGTATVLVVLANTALMVFIVAQSCRSLGTMETRLFISVVIAVTGASFALESVHSTFIDGQINLLLVALVLADLTGRTDHPARGFGVGLAVALKLTPLIFVAYLIVTRKYRQAAVASACAGGTVIVSFLLTPTAAADYWIRGMFADLGRIFVDPASRHNQSLRGLLLKNGVPEDTALWLWLVIAAAVGVAALTLAAHTARRGEHVLAISLCGLCAAAVSPWSWGHHWVWLVPFGVFLMWVAAQPRRRTLWLPAAVLLASTLPVLLALADPMEDGAVPVLTDGPLAFVLANLYVLTFLTILVTTAVDLRGSRVRSVRGAERPRETGKPVRFRSAVNRRE
ncbi:glycosyltransferase 87 family protein [Streptomyces subrutilus]|uniref:glycosyltransferase 87 family protein n=1 Tax=Streptomyces subrutilus TaxID=36818 RepID=UPI002E107F4D|nr:glycosyltransferase 87 family protein [Streptomyces subrutilus]